MIVPPPAPRFHQDTQLFHPTFTIFPFLLYYPLGKKSKSEGKKTKNEQSKGNNLRMIVPL